MKGITMRLFLLGTLRVVREKTKWCLLMDHMNKIRFRYTIQPSKRIQSDPSIPIDLVSVEVVMHPEYSGL